jgi:hypothetical protein
MKISIYNKLFIAFFALLLLLIIWKVPHEKSNDSVSASTPTENIQR